jgi:glycosyltransferase involved in cell wall biosynthesis
MMMEHRDKNCVVYLSYNGLMEPLGQSQVLAYLRHLSLSYRITLVTFEKADDLARASEREALEQVCKTLGIRWIPRVYRRSPRIPATAWDIAMQMWDIGRLSMAEKVDLVHCRGYIPAMAACLMGKMTRTPYIFDMRSLWLREMIQARTLREGSLTHLTLARIEKHLLSSANYVVSLTHAAVDHLQKTIPDADHGRYVVIPTCVELDRFRLREKSPSVLTVGSMGTIQSGWYHIEWLFRLYQETCKRNPDAKLKVVTRDDPDSVREVARKCGVDLSNLVLERASPQQVPEKIVEMSFGVLFFSTGLSKLGSSPTRMAEFLACGIPVICNRGVGDMPEIVERYGVGVVVEDGSEESLAKGVDAMFALLKVPDLGAKCRAVAENLFSAAWGAKEYGRVYEDIVVNNRCCCAVGDGEGNPA